MEKAWRQEQAQNKDREAGTKPGMLSGTRARGWDCPWDEAQLARVGSGGREQTQELCSVTRTSLTCPQSSH